MNLHVCDEYMAFVGFHSEHDLLFYIYSNTFSLLKLSALSEVAGIDSGRNSRKKDMSSFSFPHLYRQTHQRISIPLPSSIHIHPAQFIQENTMYDE